MRQENMPIMEALNCQLMEALNCQLGQLPPTGQDPMQSRYFQLMEALNSQLRQLYTTSQDPMQSRWLILLDEKGTPLNYEKLLEDANRIEVETQKRAQDEFITVLGEGKKIQICAKENQLIMRAQGDSETNKKNIDSLNFPKNPDGYLMITFGEIIQINDVANYGYDFADMLYWLKHHIKLLPLPPTNTIEPTYFEKISTITSPMKLVDILEGISYQASFEEELIYFKEVLKVFDEQITVASKFELKETCKQALIEARDSFKKIVTNSSESFFEKNSAVTLSERFFGKISVDQLIELLDMNIVDYPIEIYTEKGTNEKTPLITLLQKKFGNSESCERIQTYIQQLDNLDHSKAAKTLGLFIKLCSNEKDYSKVYTALIDTLNTKLNYSTWSVIAFFQQYQRTIKGADIARDIARLLNEKNSQSLSNGPLAAS